GTTRITLRSGPAGACALSNTAHTAGLAKPKAAVNPATANLILFFIRAPDHSPGLIPQNRGAFCQAAGATMAKQWQLDCDGAPIATRARTKRKGFASLRLEWVS